MIGHSIDGVTVKAGAEKGRRNTLHIDHNLPPIRIEPMIWYMTSDRSTYNANHAVFGQRTQTRTSITAAEYEPDNGIVNRTDRPQDEARRTQNPHTRNPRRSVPPHRGPRAPPSRKHRPIEAPSTRPSLRQTDHSTLAITDQVDKKRKYIPAPQPPDLATYPFDPPTSDSPAEVPLPPPPPLGSPGHTSARSSPPPARSRLLQLDIYTRNARVSSSRGLARSAADRGSRYLGW